jgi:transcriptional regulator of acetoin/glycerol metabolism
VVRVDDLREETRNGAPARPVEAGAVDYQRVGAASGGPGGTLREFKDASERAFLVQKLRENNWNISKTAEVIDTPRSNLYKKLEQYGIRQEVDG